MIIHLLCVGTTVVQFHGFLSICTLHAEITPVINIETVETRILSTGVWQLRELCSFYSLVFVNVACNG